MAIRPPSCVLDAVFQYINERFGRPFEITDKRDVVIAFDGNRLVLDFQRNQHRF